MKPIEEGKQAFNADSMRNVGEDVGDVSEMKLTERQQKILGIISESPTVSGRPMSDMLSVRQRTIERDISLLKRNGILIHEGKDNDGRWKIRKK